VSGGHTLLAYLEDQHSYELLGTTRDDSVGECYDKVARTLGLGMPGGPAIDRMAASGTARIKFPRPMIHSGYEFSFSGLKSSVARYVETHPEFVIDDVAASFVDACLDVLGAKLRRAIAQKARLAGRGWRCGGKPSAACAYAADQRGDGCLPLPAAAKMGNR